MRNARQILTKLLLLCVSLAVVSGLVEVALRIRPPQDITSFRRPLARSTGQGCRPLFVYDSVRGSRTEANCATTSTEPRHREYSITIHTNNHGFRDHKDYPIEKRPGTRRVVVIGDSFSYGNGVEELGRYSNLLDDLLGEKVEVYNLAISNYGLDQALLTLQAEGLRYDPDVIVVALSNPMFDRLSRKVTSSLWSKPFFTLEQDTLRPSPQPGEHALAVESFLDHSYLWMFLTQRISAIMAKPNPAGTWARNAALTERIIERLVALSRQSKSSLVIFTINPRYILEQGGDSLPAVNRLVSTLSKRDDFHFLDLHPIVTRSDYASLFYPIDGHYNVRGHILVAEELCTFIQSRGILAGTAIGSCDVEDGAVDKSLEQFRRCDPTGTPRGWFPGGTCFPRE